MAETAVVVEEFTLPSTDGKSTCVGTLWLPEGREPGALFQISHGMAEHIQRYDRIARVLVGHGFAVYGIDHIGHGRTQPARELRGIFDHEHAADQIVEDQHAVRLLMQERFPGLPLVFLGHSMGSFIARNYIALHGEGLAGAIIMGTGWMDDGIIKALRVVVAGLAKLRGWDHRSAFVDGMGVGGYNKAFKGTGANTGFEWLSRNDACAIAYRDDPDCGFMFSIGGYWMLADLMSRAQDSALAARIPKDLPVLVISGSKDPVGSDGVGPAKYFRLLQDAGVEKAEFEVISGARHEILNEIGFEETDQIILDWMKGFLGDAMA